MFLRSETNALLRVHLFEDVAKWIHICNIVLKCHWSWTELFVVPNTRKTTLLCSETCVWSLTNPHEFVLVYQSRKPKSTPSVGTNKQFTGQKISCASLLLQIRSLNGLQPKPSSGSVPHCLWPRETLVFVKRNVSGHNQLPTVSKHFFSGLTNTVSSR